MRNWLKPKIKETIKIVPQKATACNVIQNILDRGIEWYNYEELQDSDRQTYYSNAQNIIKNPVFENEINHYVADLVKEIAKNAPDFKTVRDLRMSINGVEAFKERLESISFDKKQVTTDDLHSVI